MSWERPHACRQCDHRFDDHVIAEPGENQAGWMLCTGRGCSCWHDWPTTGNVNVKTTDGVSNELAAETVERERCQLQLMLHTIVDFRGGAIPVLEAINNLDGLVAELALVGDACREQLSRSILHGLEVPYANASDRGTRMPDAEDPTIARVLDELQQMVARHLATVIELDRSIQA